MGSVTNSLRGTLLSGFAHCVSITGDCVILNSRLTNCSKECVIAQTGMLTMKECVVKCSGDALAAIVYDNRDRQASFTGVSIRGSRIGVLLQGDCLLEDCCIERCKQVGVQIDNKEDPLSVVLKRCVVNRCTEGIRGKEVDLVVVESTVKYCETGILVTDSSFVQCLKSRIHSCHSLAIACQSVLSVQVSENCIYDCQKGICLAAVRYFRMESNCVAYVRQSVLLFRHTMVIHDSIRSDE